MTIYVEHNSSGRCTCDACKTDANMVPELEC
jgi:hypothetical protein